MLDTLRAAEGQGRERRADPASASPASSVLQHEPARLCRSCSTTRTTSPTTCAPTSPASRRRPARSSRSSTSTPRSTGSTRPSCCTWSLAQVRRDRPAPRRGLQPRDGLPLRGADPQFSELSQRDRRRALHPARGHPPDGEPAVHRGRRRPRRRRASCARCSTRPAAPAACSRVAEDHLRELNPRRPPRGLRPGAQRRDLRDLPLRHDAQGPERVATSTRQLLHRGRSSRASASTTCSPTRRSAWSGRRSSATIQRRARASSASPAASAPGLPRINDGSFLFLQHMISQDEAARARAAAAWRSCSTARRCSPAAPGSGE